MSFTSWFIAAGLVLWGYLLVALRRRRLALERLPVRSPAPARRPSLSVIHPIRGLDPGADANVRAALDVDYDGELESIFVFDDEREPALPIVRAAIDELGAADARVLIAGPPRPGYTGKLSAMNAGVAAAKGELIAFVDSDVRVDRDTFRVLVDLLLDRPRAGVVFAPVVVSEPAASPGDVGYQLMLNSLYSPEVALWDRAGKPLPFIMGQLMVFRRDTLEAIGSVDCARGQLVDDMHIGTHVVEAGLLNVMSTRPIRIVEWGMSLTEFARSARRWLVFSRSGIPGRFALGPALQFLAFWVGLVGFVDGIHEGSPLAALVGVGLMATTCAALLAQNRYTGGPPVPVRWWWMPFVMLILGPFVYVTTWIWPEVRWRGRVYELNAKASLDTEPGALVGRLRRVLHAGHP